MNALSQAGPCIHSCISPLQGDSELRAIRSYAILSPRYKGVRALVESMMNWQEAQGGPAVQLRLYAGLTQSVKRAAMKSAQHALLDMAEVQALLSCLDAFNTPNRDSKALEHLIHYHKDTCIQKSICTKNTPTGLF